MVMSVDRGPIPHRVAAQVWRSMVISNIVAHSGVIDVGLERLRLEKVLVQVLA
jgi:hypothetical protein